MNKAHWLNDGGAEVLVEIDRIRSLRNGLSSNLSAKGGLELEAGVKGVKGIKIVHGNTLTSAVVCDHLKNLLREYIFTQSNKNIRSSDIENLNRSSDIKNDQGNELSKVPVLMDIILVGATSKIGRAVAVTMAGTEGVRVICVG